MLDVDRERRKGEVAQKAVRDEEKKKALLKQAERLIKEEQKSESKA